MKMTSTRIELSFNKTARLADLSDLAELLFPGNRNQQHAFLAVYIELKWADHHMVPNLADIARQHRISRRTIERVRAKMRRLGLVDHVSRFNASRGYREGWVMSGRFVNSLWQFAEKVSILKDVGKGSKDKDMLLLEFGAARRRAARRDDVHQKRGGEAHVQTAVQEAGRRQLG